MVVLQPDEHLQPAALPGVGGLYRVEVDADQAYPSDRTPLLQRARHVVLAYGRCVWQRLGRARGVEAQSLPLLRPDASHRGLSLHALLPQTRG